MNKVYSINFSNNIAPGANNTLVHDINNIGRRFKIKSIFFDLRTEESVTGIPLNLFTQNTQRYYLSLGIAGAVIPKIAECFLNIPGDPIVNNNGNYIIMANPGQIKLDSFYINEYARFIFNYSNFDLLLNYTYFSQTIVEIETE